ncbi:hypothetical protein G5V59_16865 [Nocardioides sp. W3-2-3]|uniref:hypothetical protein n=1 Tax=Nocardioides convexus TaxID=2712224 RepID=UPI0024184FFD|nr:hypothetical protein [Nocardioides convexus]NHA00995.1 hypothetical protein [Nocardioides convexus]
MLTDPTAGLARDGRLFYAEQARRRRGPPGRCRGARGTGRRAEHGRDLHAAQPRGLGPHHLPRLRRLHPAAGRRMERRRHPGRHLRRLRRARDQRHPHLRPGLHPHRAWPTWPPCGGWWRRSSPPSTSTSPPRTRAPRRSTAGSDSDPTYGTRAVFTDDRDARGTVCSYGSGGSGCAGIAWVDVFADIETGRPAGYYEPAWIYTTVADFQARREAGR